MVELYGFKSKGGSKRIIRASDQYASENRHFGDFLIILSNMKYKWDVQKYRELVERTTNLDLKKYIDSELDFIIDSVDDSSNKTFIEMGAGYGRAIPKLSTIARNFIAIEINKDMFSGLDEIASKLDNVSTISGDGSFLSNLLNDLDINEPVIMSLQNSLGTSEGDPNKILSEMFQVASNNNGEVIISLFTQEGLKRVGLSIYDSVSGLTGKPDLFKINFGKGDFISQTGYKSHWWRREEIDNIIKMSNGILLNELKEEYFYILHIGFKK